MWVLSPGRGLVSRKDCYFGNLDCRGIERCVCSHWAQHGGLGHPEAQLVVGASISLFEAEYFLEEFERVYTGY